MDKSILISTFVTDLKDNLTNKIKAMKKFQKGNDVVITMTESEYDVLKALATSGCLRKQEQGYWDDEELYEFRKITIEFFGL